MLAGILAGHLCLPLPLLFLNSGVYGVALFLGVPLATGMASAFILGRNRLPAWAECAWSASWSMLTLAVYCLVLRWEGVICLVMALPLTLPLAMLGSAVGLGILVRIRRSADRILLPWALVLPLTLILAPHGPASPSYHRHVTERIIDARPERVWPLLFNLRDLPPPKEWPFRLKIAYPVEIRTSGLYRECILSTGTMPERIVDVEKNRRLRFEVLWTPPSMRETNPFGPVHSWHNDNGFQCLVGEFDLSPLPGGRTLVRASSLYRHVYAPDWYWTLWTDATVAAVHSRVLEEIERRVTARRLDRGVQGIGESSPASRPLGRTYQHNTDISLRQGVSRRSGLKVDKILTEG